MSKIHKWLYEYNNNGKEDVTPIIDIFNKTKVGLYCALFIEKTYSNCSVLQENCLYILSNITAVTDTQQNKELISFNLITSGINYLVSTIDTNGMEHLFHLMANIINDNNIGHEIVE